MNIGEAVHDLKAQLQEGLINETDSFGEKTIEVHSENVKDALIFLKESGFEVLMDLTGVDYLEPIKQTKVVYWLHNPSNYERLRLIVFVGRGSSLPSVTDLWEGADWYERELFDLFGIKFEGHPDLKRILMPDDWQGHPLLRDYALTEEPVAFKHGILPKVPSQIIPYFKGSKNLTGPS